MIRGVPGEVDLARRRRHAPATPQRPVAVAEPARAEVPRRRAPDGKLADARFLPPVELEGVARAALPYERRQPEGHEPPRLRMRRGQTPHGAVIQVVVVIVREQHGVDRREPGERDRGGHAAARACELNGRRALAPDGIREQVETPHLQQEGRMPDPGEHESIERRAWDREARHGHRERRRIGSARGGTREAVDHLPFEDAAQPLRRVVPPRVAEPAGRGMMRLRHRRPPARRTASGRPRSASIATTPSAGPGARTAMLHRQPQRMATAGRT